LITELVVSVLSWAELEKDDSRFDGLNVTELDNTLEVTTALGKNDVASLATLAGSEADADDAKVDVCEDSSGVDSDGDSDVDDVKAEIRKDDADVASKVVFNVDSEGDDDKAKVCEDESSADSDVDSEVDDPSVDADVDSEVDDVKSEI
jgi:hypothetical protein